MKLELAKEKRGIFCTVYFVHSLCFISMYSVLNTLSEYTCFYISKNFTSYTFLLVSKIVENLQCILKTENFSHEDVLCNVKNSSITCSSFRIILRNQYKFIFNTSFFRNVMLYVTCFCGNIKYFVTRRSIFFYQSSVKTSNTFLKVIFNLFFKFNRKPLPGNLLFFSHEVIAV